MAKHRGHISSKRSVNFCQCAVLLHAFLLSVIVGLGQLARAQDHLDANAVFGKRFSSGLKVTLQELRAVHEKQPNDASTRYYLATVLLESADDLKTVAEALTLLDGLEKAPAPPAPSWLSMWAMARQVDAASRLQSLTAKNWAALPKGPDFDDTNFQAFLKDRFNAIDSTLLKLRAATIAKTSFTGDEVRADLHQLVDLLRARWAYVCEKQAQTGHSLDDLLRAALSEVQPTMTRIEAARLLRRFVGSLDDGHTAIQMSAGEALSLPFRAIDTADGVIVAQIAAGADALRPGDRLLEVDGRKVEDIVAEEGAMYSVSTEQSRRAHGVAQIQIIHHGRKEVPVRIERGGEEQVMTCFSPKEIPIWIKNKTGKNWINSKLLTPQIGYLKVQTWMPATAANEQSESEVRALNQESYTQIDAALKPLENATDIIIDLRDNGGGRDQLCCYLGSYFFSDRPVKPYVLRYRAVPMADGSLPPGTGDDGFYNPKSAPTECPSFSGPAWKARLWVLVNEACFSATDTFLDLLTSRMPPERIHTIGRPSQGGIGGPAPVGTLHNTDAALTVSTCRVYDLEGHLLEGHPARIDLPVKWTRADVLTGRDADLDAALQMIAVQK